MITQANSNNPSEHDTLGDSPNSSPKSLSEFVQRQRFNERRGTRPRNLYAVKSCDRRNKERRSET